MELITIFTHPFVTTVLKMLLLFFIILGLSKLKLTANRQAEIWRMGLILLLLLPWLNNLSPVINIPVLPSQDIQLPNTLNSTLVPLGAGTDFINFKENGLFKLNQISTLMLLFSISLISFFLVAKIIRQLKQLKYISKNANAITNKPWLRQAHRIAKKLELQQLPLILQSKLINSPSTWGFKRPVILLPVLVAPDEEEINDEMQVVLLHEMAHIKRNDWIWLMVAKVTTALFWFNPLMWFIKNKLISSFERACDELVLQQPIKPSCYVETLLQFHNQQQNILFNITTGMAQHSAMYIRLQHILNPRKRSQSMHKNKQNIIMLTAFTATVLITVSQLTMAHQPDGKVPNSQATVEPIAQPPKAPSPDLHKIPGVHPTHAVAPTAPVVPHADRVHPTAPVHTEHEPVVAPPQPIEPTEPQADYPKRENEIQQKLELAEQRIKQLEARLAQKEAYAGQQLSLNSQALSEVEEKRLKTKLQALKSIEVRVKQLESQASEQQHQLMANMQQIHAKKLEHEERIQQARIAANELTQRLQGQKNNQQ